RLLSEQCHARVPVYREPLDDVIGFVHVKDVLAPVADRRPVKLAPLLRKVLVVAPSLPVFDLLVQMRQTRTHIAMVVDEFGGIDGLVTIEDVIEEIVGEIEDEHDDADKPKLIERPDGSLIADGRTSIEALRERGEAPLLPPEQEEGVDTLAGRGGALAGPRRDHQASCRPGVRSPRRRSAPHQARACARVARRTRALGRRCLTRRSAWRSAPRGRSPPCSAGRCGWPSCRDGAVSGW